MEMQELRVASLDAFWDSFRMSIRALSVNFSFAYGNVTNKLNVEIYVTHTVHCTALYFDILHSCKRNGTKMMTHTIFKSNCSDSILNSKKRRQFTQKKESC